MEPAVSPSPKKIIVQGLPSTIVKKSKVVKPPDVNTENVKNLFSLYGTVVDCSLYIHANDEIENFAYITYWNEDDAIKAHAAAMNHEIKMRSHTLTATLISHDSALIDRLDDLCLIKIFSLLGNRDKINLETVCKRWKDLARRSWYNVKELDGRKKSKAQFKACIIRCGRFLDEVRFSMQTPGYLSLIKKHCRDVQKVSVCHCYNMDVKELFTTIGKLKKLKSFTMKNIQDCIECDALVDLPESLKEIHLFGLANEGELESQDYSKFHNLQKLVINGLFIPLTSIQQFEGLKNLNHLNVYNCHRNIDVVTQIPCLRNLKVLVISHYPIDDSLLRNIVRSNRGLEDLNISHITSLTDASLRAVSTLPHLRCLKMSNLPNVTLTLIDAMPHLEYLDCEDCSKVGEEQLLKILNSSPRLKYLNAASCKITCEFFEAVAAIVKIQGKGITLRVDTDEDVLLEEAHPLLTIYNSSGRCDFPDIYESSVYTDTSDETPDYTSSSEAGDLPSSMDDSASEDGSFFNSGSDDYGNERDSNGEAASEGSLMDFLRRKFQDLDLSSNCSSPSKLRDCRGNDSDGVGSPPAKRSKSLSHLFSTQLSLKFENAGHLDNKNNCESAENNEAKESNSQVDLDLLDDFSKFNNIDGNNG